MKSKSRKKKTLDIMDDGDFFSGEDITSNKKFYHGFPKKKWILYPDEFFKSKWDLFITM